MTDTQRTEKIVVLSVDLMDRSKISTAFPDAEFVRSPAKLAQAATDATLVLVDLAKLNDPAALLAVTARVVGFGSHVNEAQLVAAEAAGAEAMPRSVFFKRLESGKI